MPEKQMSPWNGEPLPDDVLQKAAIDALMVREGVPRDHLESQIERIRKALLKAREVNNFHMKFSE